MASFKSLEDKIKQLKFLAVSDKSLVPELERLKRDVAELRKEKRENKYRKYAESMSVCESKANIYADQNNPPSSMYADKKPKSGVKCSCGAELYTEEILMEDWMPVGHMVCPECNKVYRATYQILALEVVAENEHIIRGV